MSYGPTCVVFILGVAYYVLFMGETRKSKYQKEAILQK
jgi:hypothetical protein